MHLPKAISIIFERTDTHGVSEGLTSFIGECREILVEPIDLLASLSKLVLEQDEQLKEIGNHVHGN